MTTTKTCVNIITSTNFISSSSENAGYPWLANEGFLGNQSLEWQLVTSHQQQSDEQIAFCVDAT